MKKILFILFMFTSSLFFAQNKIALVTSSSNSNKLFVKAPRDISKELKKDKTIRKFKIEVIKGYNKLSSLKESNYKEIILIDGDKASGVDKAISDFISKVSDKNKVLLLSFYNNTKTITVQSKDESDLKVDTIATSSKHHDPVYDEFWKDLVKTVKSKL